MLRDPSFRRRLCPTKVDNIQSGCGHLHTAQISSQGCRLKTIKRKKKCENLRGCVLLLLNKQTGQTEQTDRQSKLTKKEIQIEEKEDKFCQKKKVVIEESTQKKCEFQMIY